MIVARISSIAKHCTVSVTFAPTVDGARTGTSLLHRHRIRSSADACPLRNRHRSRLPDQCRQRLIRIADCLCGSTGELSLVFTPAGGFNGTITLACSGAPTGATCTATPASLPRHWSVCGDGDHQRCYNRRGLHASNPNISARATRLFRFPFEWRGLGLPLGLFLLLAFLAIVSGHARQPTRLALAAVAMLVLMLAGCGGGGGSVSTGPPASPPLTPATPTGSYTITVTATSGALSQNMRLTLTVK